jgi:hypothetical protein
VKMWRWISGGRVSSDGGDSGIMVVGRHSSDDSEVMIVCWMEGELLERGGKEGSSCREKSGDHLSADFEKIMTWSVGVLNDLDHGIHSRVG